MSRWKIHRGMVKASLWPEPPDGSECWIPNDEEEGEVLSIEGVEEVSSDGAQSFKVIVKADSIEQLPAIVDRVATAVLEIVRKHHRRNKRESTRS